MSYFPGQSLRRHSLRNILFAAVTIIAVGTGAIWSQGYLEPGDLKQVIAAGPASSAQFQRLLREANQGIMSSQFQVAEAFETGEGTAINPEEAAYWYEQAALQGHITSAYLIGKRYENGDGVRANARTAATWFRLAAGLGNDPRAQYALGSLFFEGRGVPNDYGAAIDWYRRAANQGHPVAQYLLGILSKEGWGVDHDLIEAYKWFLLASRQQERVIVASFGRYNPTKARAALAMNLNTSQIDEAIKRADAWSKRP